jgi:Family of unknown function (DUF6152)
MSLVSGSDGRREVSDKVLGGFLGAIFCLAVSSPLAAHHGAAGYDPEKQLVMKATVSEWLWANPHCFLKYDTTDDKGEVAHWAAEVSNPVDMTKRGWTKHSLNVGDQITVTVRPAKNGAPVGQLLKVVLPNGQTLIGWPAAVR